MPRSREAADVRGSTRGPGHGKRRALLSHILFLTCHLPYPPISGGRRREYELLKRLCNDLDVHVVTVSKTYSEDLESAPLLEKLGITVNVFPALRPAVTTSSEPSSEPFQVIRHRAPEATRHVARLLEREEFDLVHVEAFYMMQHVPEPCPVPVFLQEQNVEYVLWRQRTEIAHDAREREAHLGEYLKTLKAEIGAWERSDLCAAITEDDYRIMTQAVNGLAVRVAPDGVDHLCSTATEPSDDDIIPRDRPIVAFVANFDYQPNLDAARYLCTEIMPLVFSRVPSACLLLVGNAPPAELLALAGANGSTIVTGRVERVEPYIDAADVVVCPLRIGGGIKVKILEALCRGKAVVTTSVGIQGLGPDVHGALFVQDEPHSFARTTARLLRKPVERERAGRAAVRFAARLPTWDEASTALRGCYEELMVAHRHRKAVVMSGDEELA